MFSNERNHNDMRTQKETGTSTNTNIIPESGNTKFYFYITVAEREGFEPSHQSPGLTP